MKRIFVALMILVLTGSACFGAVSEDMEVYVRKDVFDAKMEAFMAEIRLMNEQLRGEIRALNAKIDGVETSLNAKMDGKFATLSERIDGVDAKLSGRIDGLDARISDLRNGLYLGLVLFGVVIGLPFFNKWREERRKEKEEQRRPSFTLDDVRRLIEENNAELRRSLQV